MTTWQLFTSTWHWHPSVLLGCCLLLVGYLAAVRFRAGSTALFYLAGILVLLVALSSPLHVLGDQYLFSAHMLQHLLLILIVPPLLLLGIPASLVNRALTWAPLGRVERVLRRPLVAGLIGNAVIWIWHLPILYNAALGHEVFHIVEHLCFLLAAFIFWWPVLAPAEESRLAPPVAMLYIFSAMASHTVLGIILTFAQPGLYPAYLEPADTLRILPLLRNGWGLSPAADQQFGGLLMWVPGNLVYFFAFIGALARWYSLPEEDIVSFSSQIKGHEPSQLAYQERRSDAV
jgi:cytochrome c oxidase assembly factor CtaG